MCIVEDLLELQCGIQAYIKQRDNKMVERHNEDPLCQGTVVALGTGNKDKTDKKIPKEQKNSGMVAKEQEGASVIYDKSTFYQRIADGDGLAAEMASAF